MSAFAGILQRDGAPADRVQLGAMMKRIAHRGPDGSGTHVAGPLALAHLLLQVTPESIGEVQPLILPEHGLVVAFDGRIDNRGDLIATLRMGSISPPPSDAHLVAHAYRQWGKHCSDRLLGEFAFAMWDSRSRTLYCARDVFGSRDLYYYDSGSRFVFATDLAALLSAPGVTPGIDEVALGCRLAGVVHGPERTLYRGICKLLPAHGLTVAMGCPPQTQRYWRLEMEPEIRLRSNEDYAAALRELIVSAVQVRLRCAAGIGVALSGGLDSSGIACIAARELASRGRRMLAASNVVPDGIHGADSSRQEREFIQMVHSQETNLDPRWAFGSTFPAIELDDGLLDRLGEPLQDPFAFRTREIAAIAEEYGARLILTGFGGDMAASYRGSGLLVELARQGSWLELIREVRIQSRIRRRSGWGIFKGQVLFPLVPRPVRTWRERWRGPGQTVAVAGPIHPEFEERLDLRKWRAESPAAEWPQYFRRAMVRLVNSGFGFTGSAWLGRHGGSLEAAHPLLDRRIWEFAFRVPPRQFCLDRVPRSLYRRALQGFLPEGISQRTSKGWFAPDYRQALLADRPRLESFLADHPAGHLAWQFVHRPALEEGLRRLSASKLESRWDPSLHSVLVDGFRIAHFLSWLERKGACG